MSLGNCYLHLSLFCKGEDAQVLFPQAASHLRGKGRENLRRKHYLSVKEL